MATWNVEQVGHWLKTNGLKKHVKKFRDRNIDGAALMTLADEEIVQLLSEVQGDGTVRKPTIGAQSRFREKLLDLKRISAQEEKAKSNAPIRSNKDRSESPSEIVSNSPPIKSRAKKHRSHSRKDTSSMEHSHQTPSQAVEQADDPDTTTRQFKYIIDAAEHVPFFANPKFLSHFIRFVQEKTIPIPIDLAKTSDDREFFSPEYTLNVTGTKAQYRIVKDFVKKLLGTVQAREYKQRIGRLIGRQSTDICFLQDILDRETQMFTVCQIKDRALVVLCFHDDEFNNARQISAIDDLIEHQVVLKKLFLSVTDRFLLIKYIDPATGSTAQTENIYSAKPFRKELDQLLNSQKGNRPWISISEKESSRNGRKDQTTIEIFGLKRTINPLLTRIEDLFRKYRLQWLKFTQLSSNEIACLNQIGLNGLKTIEMDFRDDSVKLDMEKGEFYAPQYLADDVESRVKNLLATFKKLTFDIGEFYYDLAEKSTSYIRQLARNNRCHSKVKLKTKWKPYPMLRTSNGGNSLSTSTSESVSGQSFVACEATLPNGSVEVCIADIAEQRADVLIIPSMTSGLKEHLIERAGNIEERHPSNPNNSMSFITETTAGRLHCQEILFVNWSPPGRMADEELFSQSVRSFITKVIQHALKNGRRSLAIAMPEVSHHDQIFAEEMLDEIVDQIRRVTAPSLHVSFIFAPNQHNLHRHFVNIVQSLQTTDKTYGNFYCPTSMMTITLTALDDQDLTRCEKKINRYFERSMIRKEVDDFDGWNQELVNGFYTYCQEASVLPQINDQEQVVLLGPITNVHQVYQKYQFTNVLTQMRLSPQQYGRKSTAEDFQIVLSYALGDSKVCHWLRTRLISEGFSVWMQSDPSEDTMSKIDRSDLLILCFSEKYFDEPSCVREAKYAHQAKKNILPIRVQYCQLMGSLRRVVEKQTCLSFYGSQEYLNLQFDKLLLIILQKMKGEEDGSIMKCVQTNALFHFLLTPEQRELGRDKRIKALVKSKHGRIKAKDRQDLIDEVEKIIRKGGGAPGNPAETSSSDYRKQKPAIVFKASNYACWIASLRHWIDSVMMKPTKHNLPPLTYTGDFNDAPFPMIDIVAEYLSLPAPPEAEDATSDRSSDSRAVSPMEVKSAAESPVRRRIKSISRATGEENEDAGTAVITSEEKDTEKERETSEPVRPWKRTSKIEHEASSRYSPEQHLEWRRKFAEQMANNQTAFDKFCREHRHRSKKKVKADIAAIFTPSPFSNANAQPRKALQTRTPSSLPLKFVWNGVQDECTRKPRLNITSVLFFHEPAPMEN